MLEKRIEAYLVYQVQQRLNGVAYKFTSPQRRSVPDRLIVLRAEQEPGVYFAKFIYVECKAPGAKPTPAQEREHARLRAMGARVEVVSSKDQVDRLIEELGA